MPIVQGGKVAAVLRYIDEDGVEHHVVQVRLGDHMVWDGTIPALASVQQFAASGRVLPPSPSAGQSITSPDVSATSEFRALTVSAGARVPMPTMSAAGQLHPSGVAAAVYVEILAASATAGMSKVSAGQVAAGVARAPAFTGSAVVVPPTVVIPAAVNVQLATSAGEVRSVTVNGLALAQAVAAAASGQMRIPALRAGRAQAMPRATATAKALTPSASGAAAALASTFGAAGQFPAAVVAVPYPAGMDKVGTQQIPRDSNISLPLFPRATKVRGWAVRAGYPGTAIVDDGLEASAAMTVNFTGKVTFQAGGVGVFVQFMVVRNDSEVLAIGNTGSTLTGTAALAPNDTLSLYAWGQDSVANAYRNIIEANTYLYWTLS
ncbi:hypothetical protein LCL87_25150 [Rhodococcus hoagii]|nr:hypothetical protein [Prescottella equi]